MVRLVTTRECKENEVLAKALYNDRGATLLHEGVKLSSSILGKLMDNGVHFIYVQDERLKDLNVEEVVSLENRLKGTSLIKNTFTDVLKNQSKVDQLVSNNVKEFKDVVNNIFEDLRGNDKALNLLSSVQAYDNYVFTHSFNVMVYSTQLAINMGLKPKQVKEIGLGALLHDIGKMLVPEHILNKKGKLDNDEFNLIKEHSELGFEILRKQYDIPLVSAHCAYQHHERLDGSGYPRGLKGDEIHLYAKIMGVGDSFDAMTSDRVYRKAMMPHTALEIIYSEAGTKFDLDIVNTFKRTVAVYPEGTGVVLNDGRKGVVTKYDRNVPARPVVKILVENGEDLAEGYEVDMRKELTIMIEDCESII